ncbi:hypothetical protein [Asanoa iriomotensis]|uniref:Uncharacterized protein n=1 Tax=Asanoa iriomotensis TaxID=234613 RepID=A0ABQ4CCR8_9ACTN|nr:hypothetical protein [Asanoa iriomotensis]GIF60556.1 hypothetical protein Air01nite_66510 [Asanoa iriomotensis]
MMKTARVLAGVAAVLALGAFISGLDVKDGTTMVEMWRTIGFATFAALFAYLAARPAAVGVWAIVLANKLALTIAAVAYGSGEAAIWDGILVVLLAAGLALATRTPTRQPAPATQD